VLTSLTASSALVAAQLVLSLVSPFLPRLSPTNRDLPATQNTRTHTSWTSDCHIQTLPATWRRWPARPPQMSGWRAIGAGLLPSPLAHSFPDDARSCSPHMYRKTVNLQRVQDCNELLRTCGSLHPRQGQMQMLLCQLHRRHSLFRISRAAALNLNDPPHRVMDQASGMRTRYLSRLRVLLSTWNKLSLSLQRGLSNPVSHRRADQPFGS
jgi:hypothetical protein